MSQQETIRTARQRLNMSQATLADAAGLSERTVKRAESGHGLSPETAQALSSVLGLPPGTLRSGPAESPAVPLLETTLPEDVLAKDPRMAEIEEMLRPGSPFDAVILPDPRPLRNAGRCERAAVALSRWLFDHPRFTLACVVAAIAFAILAVRPGSLIGFLTALLACLGAPLLSLPFLTIATRSWSGRQALERFGETAIVAVQGNLLHVIYVDPVTVTRRTFVTGKSGTWSVMRHGVNARHMLTVADGSLDIVGVPARSSLDEMATGRKHTFRHEPTPSSIQATA